VILLRQWQPCLATSGTCVPSGDDWLHEIKYDGYRLIVQRDGTRVRLITRGGYDWASRYPLIVEAALKLRSKQFVIDGEAVVLDKNGIPDFNALHSRNHDDAVEL
jgi:bifunctional non-homologous end joining protein LigD